MAHYAEIDMHDTVVRVVVVHNDMVPDEITGKTFITNLLGGNWVMCSYHGNIRNRFPGIGDKLHQNVFIPRQPFPSWVFNVKCNWEAPIPMPDGMFRWDEATGAWIERIPTEVATNHVVEA